VQGVQVGGEGLVARGGVVLLLEVILGVLSAEVGVHFPVDLLCLAKVPSLEKVGGHALHESQSGQLLLDEELKQVVFLLKGNQIHSVGHFLLHGLN
jgi:hypothetical protein